MDISEVGAASQLGWITGVYMATESPCTQGEGAMWDSTLCQGELEVIQCEAINWSYLYV